MSSTLRFSKLKNNEQVGFKVRIQKIERGNTKSFYVNFPAAIAEASSLEKGEVMEWFIEDRNTFVLKRIKEQPSIISKK